MDQKEQRDLVIDALAQDTDGYAVIFRNDVQEERENQFLFFMKPEIVNGLSDDAQSEILEIIYSGFERFHMGVESIHILSSEYLREHGVMAEHYGVIDATSRNAAEHMSLHAKNAFKDVFGVSPEKIKTLGGFDFLDAYPSFDASGLNKIWASHEFTKLGGGTYAELHKMDGEDVVMINGFYPNMLLHYTRGGRRIVLFSLKSDTSWKEARGSFIGSTLPARAEPGSIRNMLLEKKDDLGLVEISPTYNGVHLSAGPVEGLVELRRFLSERSDDSSDDGIDRFLFGKKLLSRFGRDASVVIMSNKDIVYGEDRVSVFDYTEEMDSSEALEKLEDVADQFGQ